MKIAIFRKTFFFLAISAFLLAFAYLRINTYKKEVMVISTLDGKITYDNDPEGYYKKTLLRSFDPRPKWSGFETYGTANEPIISGQSAILVDINSGKVLYEKNSQEKMKIASLTKIMTAVVALEHKNLADKIYVTRNAAYVGENTMYLTRGEVYTLRELMYGLVLNSANDAAYAIAEGTAGDVDTFVKWMDLKAQELGLTNTRFFDPSGLDDATYSTTEDLVKLATYAMKNPDFKEIVKTFEIEFTSDTHKYVYLQNQTNLLRSYPGVEGIKTGFTEEAGLCLVTYANNKGKELIGAVLNSIDRKGDMILMLDHGFSTLGINVVHHLLD